MVDKVYGCLNRVKRRFLLARLDFTGPFSEAISEPRVAGRFAAFARSGSGSAADCYSDVLAFDLRRGRRTIRTAATTTPAATPNSCGQVDGLELTRRGAVGWIVHTPGSNTAEVRKLDTGGPALLDSGNVDRGSLALSSSRRTIYWTKDGAPQSAPID